MIKTIQNSNIALFLNKDQMFKDLLSRLYSHLMKDNNNKTKELSKKDREKFNVGMKTEEGY